MLALRSQKGNKYSQDYMFDRVLDIKLAEGIFGVVSQWSLGLPCSLSGTLKNTILFV